MQLSELINRLIEIQKLCKDEDPIVALDVYDKDYVSPQVLQDDEIFVGKYIPKGNSAVWPETEYQLKNQTKTFVILG